MKTAMRRLSDFEPTIVMGIENQAAAATRLISRGF